MDALADRVTELDNVIGAGATDELWTRLCEIDDDESRCRAFERWLLQRRRAVHPYFASVRKGLELLRVSTHGTPVGEVCERLGLSNRHLIKQFRATVGLAPKFYGRIARFQRVIEACRDIDEVPWAAVAAHFGYADQSHLIREFRRLAMVTPEEFIARRTPDQSHVVGD
jgi:AraC-like DNA-binding protein